ncbi:MAG TPA: hypothetical protein DDW31_03570 [candidate division Zixibacteria bacterium]|nr:hypothetical protein [candidate division Zixibacteria bacterium]
MGLEGNLKDFDLSDILQLIHMGKKTGALEVVAETESGVIFFHEGSAVHAAAQDQSGDEAVNRILRWRQGHFAFKPEATTGYKSIRTPLQHLVLDAARQIDEWQDIQKLVPSLDLVPAIEENPSAGTEDIKLQPNEWRVLAIIDGSKNIRDIIRDGHMGDFETCKIIYGLVSSGLVKATQPPKPPPEAAPPPPQPPPAVPTPPPRPGPAQAKPEPEKKGLMGGLFGKKK